MKKALLIMLCGLLVFLTSFKITDSIDRKIEAVYKNYNQIRTVVIDAGHGGIDVGTVGIDGAYEKTINLSISLILYDYMRVAGINAVLIRNGDYEFYKDGEKRERSDLYNRLDFVNSIQHSVLISVHQNHYEDEREKGTQIWYSSNDENSQILANNILSVINANLQPDNKRQNKPSGSEYYILHKATVPSIMIECGFMSNREENNMLQQEQYQEDFAYCIMCGASGEI